MTHFNMYLFTRLDSLRGMVVAVMVILLIAFLASVILYFFARVDQEEETGRSLGKISICLLTALVIFGLLVVAIPTQKEAAAIWLVPKIVNNEQLNGIASNTFDILEVKAREYLLEITEETKGVELLPTFEDLAEVKENAPEALSRILDRVTEF